MIEPESQHKSVSGESPYVRMQLCGVAVLVDLGWLNGSSKDMRKATSTGDRWHKHHNASCESSVKQLSPV